MRSMVVLFAVCAVACGSLVPLAQPPHHPALVLDPHGRPLDTAEVIGARALHLQAKALEGHHYAPLVHAAPAVYAAHAATVWGGHAALASPLLGHSAYGLAGHGHYLKKRSLGHLAYSAPLVAAPAAVSHQSRVDVISSPAVVSHAVAVPVVAHAAPIATTYVGGSAVSHQSRVDVHSSPALVSHSVVAPVVSHSVYAAPLVSAHSVWGAPAYGAHGYSAHGYGAHGYGAHGYGAHGYGAHGHLLKKRSLALAHFLPAAVSHQSRVDVISSHVAPVAIAHAAPVAFAHAAPVAIAHAAPVAIAHAAPTVSHQSRVDVISSPAHVAPLAHSAVWTAPAHWSHSGLHSSPLAYAAHW